MDFLKNNPKVSVVIACYNSEKYIKLAIQSIKKQEYKNWELILVNDASIDSTKKIIEKYRSNKIKIINLKKNVGAYRATNIAFKKITGQYVAILDSDDYSHPKILSSQVSLLSKNIVVGLFLTRYKLINAKNKILKSNINNKFISERDFNSRFPCENLACNSSAMFRKEFIQKLKFYNKNYFYSCDYNFYLKIFKFSKIRLINKFYTFYRIHDKQRTNSFKKKIIIQENIDHLIWSVRNGLININNLFFFLKRVIILSFQYVFEVFKFE
jgi:GT2 family glycosyltransferase